MPISRTRGAYSTGYFGPLTGTSPYAKTGGEIFQYVANGSNPNDIVGATYRVHVFDKIGTDIIHFDRDGYVDVVVIAGGGAGGSGYNNADPGGGGGAGGLIQNYGYGVSAGGYQVTVGKGGVGIFTDSNNQGNGENSVFGSLVAFGGGMGASRNQPNSQSGGSGGGAGDLNTAGSPGTPGQGHSGGTSTGGNVAAGGGGAGAAGASTSGSGGPAPSGGDGLAISFYSNELIYYAGGGAGSSYYSSVGTPVGGLGGGANGLTVNEGNGQHASFYGSGGGGGASSGTNWNRGGNGYQGLVMVRYRIY